MGWTVTGKREREAPEIGAMIRRCVRSLVRRAADGDTFALEELAALERYLPGAVTEAIGAMNRYGYSYTELASVLGTSRQAARQRVTTGRDTTHAGAG